jgi:sirohydrochlorin ferrochelatase
MTKDEILSMAKESGIDAWWDSGSDWRETFNEHLERFAALVAEKEREQAEDRVTDLFEELENPYLPDIAAAIRARGNK